MKTIQNIVLDFSNDVVTTFCEEHVCYPEPGDVTNVTALKNAINSGLSINASLLVIQYTVDQYGNTGPRIVVNIDGEDTIILTFVELDANYTNIVDEIAVMKAAIQVFVDNHED